MLLRATIHWRPSASRRLPSGGSGEQGIECRVQIGCLDQACGLVVDDQTAAVGVGNGIALAIEQGDFGVRGHHMFGQRRRQLGQRQVGADHRVFAAAPGQGGADIVGGEKYIGFGGDLVLIAGGRW